MTTTNTNGLWLAFAILALSLIINEWLDYKSRQRAKKN
jgi:hypothetical protein